MSVSDIVVGYDDTIASAEAVLWAADLAAATGAALRIVHAWSWPLLSDEVTGMPTAVGAGPHNQAQRLLDEVADDVRASHRGIRVRAELVAGELREVLGEISADASLLVVGTRGLGRILSLLLGSVSRGLLHDPGCPVAIIRSAAHRAGPVLVAVDGSAVSGEAERAAGRLADAWGAPLRRVHVAVPGADRSGMAGDVEILPAPTVAEGLLATAAGSRVLVMGHRGADESAFGSAAHATVLHGVGNIVVVRRSAAGQ